MAGGRVSGTFTDARRHSPVVGAVAPLAGCVGSPTGPGYPARRRRPGGALVARPPAGSHDHHLLDLPLPPRPARRPGDYRRARRRAARGLEPAGGRVPRGRHFPCRLSHLRGHAGARPGRAGRRAGHARVEPWDQPRLLARGAAGDGRSHDRRPHSPAADERRARGRHRGVPGARVPPSATSAATRGPSPSSASWSSFSASRRRSRVLARGPRRVS